MNNYQLAKQLELDHTFLSHFKRLSLGLWRGEMDWGGFHGISIH